MAPHDLFRPLEFALDGEAAAGRPVAMPSPFDELGPSAPARAAAEVLRAELAAGRLGGADPDEARAILTALEQPGGGKMFGVLVVRDGQGRPGFLRAFSGMLGGRWDIPGFVAPIFDARARARVEPPGERLVKRLAAQARALAGDPELMQRREQVTACRARHERELEELAARHRQRRAERRRRRRELAVAAGSGDGARTATGKGPADAAQLAALDQASRADKAERRRLLSTQRDELARLQPHWRRLLRRAEAGERLARMVARGVMRRIHDSYMLTNRAGAAVTMRSLFAAGEPPSGAGDCAAPKLLCAAHALGLTPVALAEFWWGAPPPAGGRVRGAFYPACPDKCGPLLPFLLEGLEVAPPRRFRPPPSRHLEMPIVYEDSRLLVVDKPAGLLSAPPRGDGDGAPDEVADCVQTRVRDRCGATAASVCVAHRLDMDTSGLLVVALDAEALVRLQRQFARREVDKRYLAWLDGVVDRDEGTIDLALRGDPDDRPRQVHDPGRGRVAITHWRVLARRPRHTLVELYPRSGRTHQLRVHCALAAGLGAAIVGDRLYGRAGPRLLLHAVALDLRHPDDGRWLSLRSPASLPEP